MVGTGKPRTGQLSVTVSPSVALRTEVLTRKRLSPTASKVLEWFTWKTGRTTMIIRNAMKLLLNITFMKSDVNISLKQLDKAGSFISS